MLQNLFRRRAPEEEQKYFVILDRRLTRRHNPLPEYYPTLLESSERDISAKREEMLKAARKTLFRFHATCGFGGEKLPRVLFANIRLVSEATPLAETLITMQRQGPQELFQETVATMALLQMCAFYGRSEVVEHIREDLMTELLATGLRYYGIRFLRADERNLFGGARTYDVADERQRSLREEYLKSYGDVANKLARTSAERVMQIVGKKVKAPPGRHRAFLSVLRYGGILGGPGESHLSDQERQAVHQSASYIARLSRYAAPVVLEEKRPELMLAEEWGRCRAVMVRTGLDRPAEYNVHALQDLFRVLKSTVLTDFQGSGNDAVYCGRSKILVKETPRPADPGRISHRRYVAGVLLDGETHVPATRQEETEPPRTRWCCYRSRLPLPYRDIGLPEHMTSTKRITDEDPPDSALEPVPDACSDHPAGE